MVHGGTDCSLGWITYDSSAFQSGRLARGHFIRLLDALTTSWLAFARGFEGMGTTDIQSIGVFFM